MTTISSMQEFTCDICNRRFDSREGLRSHRDLHESGEVKKQMTLPSTRTVALVAGITAGILVASIIAWRIARRKSQPRY
ncbi:MAG TPA: C2H2-type zinc finger protein [Nitrososphaera sp.]|nr:C2H2-type zinc finger protein [Nitrososphaera sp.]